MSILNYFKRQKSVLPQPENVPGVAASTVHAANHSVQESLQRKRLSQYNHYSYQTKLDIGRYAFVHGDSAAVRKFSQQLLLVRVQSGGLRRKLRLC